MRGPATCAAASQPRSSKAAVAGGRGKKEGERGRAPPSELTASAAAALRPPEPPAAPLRNWASHSQTGDAESPAERRRRPGGETERSPRAGGGGARGEGREEGGGGGGRPARGGHPEAPGRGRGFGDFCSARSGKRKKKGEFREVKLRGGGRKIQVFEN